MKLRAGQTLEGSILRIAHSGTFGFIGVPGQTEDLFFSVRQIQNIDPDVPLQNHRVRFEVERNEQGYAAVNIRPAD